MKHVLVPRSTGTVALWLLVALLLQLPASGSAQGACTVLSGDGPAQPLEGLHCITGVSGDAELTASWSFSASELNSRPVTVTLSAARGQQVLAELLLPDGSSTFTSLSAEDGAVSEAVWFLLPADYLLRFTVSGAEGRFVFTADNPGPRLSVTERASGGPGRESSDRGPFLRLGSLAGGSHVSRWTVPDAEEAPLSWRLRFGGLAGFPLTLKLFDEAGAELLHEEVPAGATRELTELNLPSGVNTFVLSPAYEAPQAGYFLSAEQLGPLTGATKQWRTGSQTAASRISLESGISGQLDEDGTDWYHLQVSEAEAGWYALELSADSSLNQLCLHGAGGTELMCARISEPVTTVPLLRLAAGDYWLALTGMRTNLPEYRVTFSVAEPPRDETIAFAPAGSRATAFPVPEAGGVRLTHGGRSTSWLRFEVAEPGLYRVQVQGPGELRALSVTDGAGTAIRSGRQARLDNVPLRAGTNYIALDAETGQYALRVLRIADLPSAEEPQPAAAEEQATPTGLLPAELDNVTVAARPAGIVVPGTNHGASTAVRLAAATDYTATIDGPDAHYRFTLLADSLVRLTLTPPEDGDMRLRLFPAVDSERRSTVPGEPLVLEHWLSAGDYRIEVRMNNDSRGWYTLRHDVDTPLDLPPGVSPADPANARPLPADLQLNLRAASRNRYFLLPVSPVATELLVQVGRGSFVDIHVLQHPDTQRGRRLSRLDADEEAGVFRVELEADVQYQLELGASQEPWDLQFSFSGGVVAQELPDPRELLDLQLSLATTQVASYSRFGQSLTGSLLIASSATDNHSFGVAVHVSDPRAEVSGLPAEVELAAGASLELPFTLRLPSDLRSDRPFRLSLGLSNAAGETAVASYELLATCDAPPMNAAVWIPEPFRSLAYWNHALAYHGTVISGHPSDRDIGNVIDGRLAVTRPRTFEAGQQFTLELGRQTLIEAVALHPVGAGASNERLREFRVELSSDGETWETVLSDSLTGAATEQVFPLSEPRQAGFARLTLISSQDRNSRIAVGEFKLLGTEAPAERFNIADPELGGHVVHSSSWVGMTNLLEGPRSGMGDSRPQASVAEGGAPFEFVLAFHENRAALISALQWQDYPLRSPRHEYLGAVEVHVSTDSPLGPWRHVTDWQLERTGGDTDEPVAVELVLEEPVWARYVRLVEIPAGAEARSLNLPSPLRVFEQTPGDGYRSILGEWGFNQREAGFELQRPELSVSTPATFGANAEPASAVVLTDSASGYVQTGVFEAWYRLSVAEDGTVKVVQVQSDGSVTFDLALFSEDGAELLAEGTSDQPFAPDPGPGEYLLRISEPVRSVAFVWDNSGSVAPFAHMIYAALDDFAVSIRPESEDVMLAVFNATGARFLLPDWTGSADEVARALNSYNRADGSSNAGAALIAVNNELRDRNGSRALLLITDAEFGYGNNPEVWQSIAATGVQIFTMHVSSTSDGPARWWMQDVASAYGGYFASAPTYADLETAFDRADCHIRQPKPYSVSVEQRDYTPAPGTLKVGSASDGVAGAVSAAGSGAIQVILDASGSMWQRLDGRFRYEIASDVLTDLVQEVLPEDVPFALRVFGNRAADVCRSDLEVALAPLDRAAVAGVIRGIEPQPFAGTPLAESILLAQADLADASGPRTVILITDGEESCDGDVIAAISELRAGGFDVVLNIIGFDFDAQDVAAARERFLGWAELGGGQYFDAADASELADALERSVAPPFEVTDASGTVVARGTAFGPPVELPGGTYSIRVLTDPVLLFDNVLIDGAAVELTLTGSPNGEE